ncbi:hypothetical protein [Actinacidiphila acididurans]|uniref:Lipoprotein n=1 Tax=Actinacidiphila acididurans TaxID=2784346 RepID=A0ABS2TUU9_9ACTN|nr:hypothetical protein [Actinacidiphila acididurans]MBM9507109.1 hypothetical protein [Actinacidiphila acididurans]
MRARTAVSAVAVVVLTAVAGCGSASGARVGPPDSGPTPPVCGDIVVTPGSPESGREVCLSVGSTLRLQLGQGEPAPAPSGGALTEVSPGVYRGARAGAAELSGFRRLCPSAPPGGAACQAVAGWKVTVDVR